MIIEGYSITIYCDAPERTCKGFMVSEEYMGPARREIFSRTKALAHATLVRWGWRTRKSKVEGEHVHTCPACVKASKA